MQDEEGRLRRCTAEEDAVRSLATCYSGSAEPEFPELICSSSKPKGCTEIFATIGHGMGDLVEGAREPFFAGVHMARICGGTLRPLLGFLSLIWGQVRSGYVVVGEKGAELFLYGRDVLPESVLREAPSRRGCRYYVILNERGEPLGWAVKRGRVLMNVLDLGWYIRSGL